MYSQAVFLYWGCDENQQLQIRSNTSPEKIISQASTENWVGSWRPHKPRGPIAAHYSSPGPKYGLPGSTGTLNHDPRKHQFPAYTFGLRHCALRRECSPGPTYFIPPCITRTGKEGVPSYSLYGRHKEFNKFRTPGPGQYYPEHSGKNVFTTAPAYTMGSKCKGFKNEQTPGPAAYSLPPMLGPKVVNKSSSPFYSMSGKSNIGSFCEDLKKSPGPASYTTTDLNTYKYKSPQFSMIGRNVMPGDSTRKPGPGAHCPVEVTVTKTKAPCFTFGIRHSPYLAPLIITGAK
ncbi:outer dense fiber protein 3-like [Erpetoichthys calabaricus]|uniref:outer dense fiber protein 3-like n=1 Tax=Erpetoichthys calabaricus TaxID=27687 RepID=UPI0010A023A0|nr:outer dense fiber protein 3-like [Erpetoichthys calabaricus]